MPGKNAQQARANLDAALGTIGERYRQGVQTADWAGPAASVQAEANYVAGVQRAISLKKRQAGIAKISNETWRTLAATKGAPIIGERIRLSLDKYQTNIAPILDAVNAAVSSLPARTTDFRANIANRLVKVVETAKRAAGKL